MQNIGNNNLESGMGQGGLLGNQLLSGAAVRKASAKTQEVAGSEGLGNVLQSFGDILKGQMANINNLQGQADQAMQTYATGGDIELHNVMLASEKANLALELGMQVRNKVITAYQEVMHMNI